MATDFNRPNRQSPIGVVVMFADTARQVIRGLWPILVIWIIRAEELNPMYVFAGGFGLLFVLSLGAYLQYRNFTFRLDQQAGEFVISEGILNRSRTVIRLDKIQQVNITQSLVQRLVGVYAIEVDTAGSNKKEGKIKAISHDLALALKEQLLDHGHSVETVQEGSLPTDTTETPFLKIGIGTLLKVGFTANYLRTIGIILAFFATIFENLRHVSENSDFSVVENAMEDMAVSTSIGILSIGTLTAVLVVNVVRTILRYYDYTITLQKGSLLLKFGLVNLRSTIVRPARVQITRVTQNYFQKKLDIMGIRVRQAGVGEHGEKNSAVEIPGCDTVEHNAILSLFYGQIPPAKETLKPNIRMLVFSVFLTIVLPLGGFWLATTHFPTLVDYTWAATMYVVLMLIVQFFSFRNYRLFVGDGMIIRRSGAWDVSRDIVLTEKIQAISVSQLFWHKNLNIGSIVIHTAGGNVSFGLGNYDRLLQLADLWLYNIEKNDINWM